MNKVQMDIIEARIIREIDRHKTKYPYQLNVLYLCNEEWNEFCEYAEQLHNEQPNLFRAEPPYYFRGVIISNAEYEAKLHEARKHEKPPIGRKPQWLHEEERIKELAEAIARYVSHSPSGVNDKVQKWVSIKNWNAEISELINKRIM